MRTQRVEMNAPFCNEHPRFAQAVEQLAVEPLISELAVKAFSIPVLPRATRRDVGGVSAQALEPIPKDSGHKLGTVSLLTNSGTPRSSIKSDSPSMTSNALMVRATYSARHSRLNSSITTRMRNLPQRLDQGQ